MAPGDTFAGRARCSLDVKLQRPPFGVCNESRLRALVCAKHCAVRPNEETLAQTHSHGHWRQPARPHCSLWAPGGGSNTLQSIAPLNSTPAGPQAPLVQTVGRAGVHLLLPLGATERPARARRRAPLARGRFQWGTKISCQLARPPALCACRRRRRRS